MKAFKIIACLSISFLFVEATSAFAAGTLPEGYTEVEYIEGNGVDSYILTDYVPEPNIDKIEAVASWPSGTVVNEKNHTLWCSRVGGTIRSWTLFLVGTKFRFDYGSSQGSALSPDVIDRDMKYTFTAEGNVFTFTSSGGNGGATHNRAADFTGGDKLILFASYVYGIGDNKSNYGTHKLYSFKVWRSGGLIHYFVPCKDPNGAATLVDICENPATMTKNGTFNAGPEGHFYDDSFFAITDDTLLINSSSSNYSSPSPAYGRQTNLQAGDTFAVSCGATVVTNATGTREYICQGWKLYDEKGTVVSNGTETAFIYTHPTPAEGRELEWQWASRALSTISDAILPVGGAAFHVDASMYSTMTTVESSDGRMLVTEWRDADGGAMKATAGTGSRPWIVTNDGLPYVDFGEQRSGAPMSSSDLSGCLAWSSRLTTIREVFLVFSDYPGSAHSFFLGDYSGNTYHFHRNQLKLFNNQYASSYVKNGLKEVDGVERTIDYELPGGFHIIHLRTTGDVTANSFARDRSNINYGGQRLQEVIVYTKTLTDAEAESVYDYLNSKWFNNPCIIEVDGSPEKLGTPSPAYGVQAVPAAGAPVPVSCGLAIATNDEDRVYACVGWKLYDENNNLVSNGLETSFLYTHPTPAAYRRLEWQWVEPLTVLPIPDQNYNFGDICRPELVVSNIVDNRTWTIGGDIVSADFDVEYANNVGAGVATVTVTGTGVYPGATASGTFNISATLLEDDNISTTESSARRLEVGDKYVYIFTNSASASSVMLKRKLVLTDVLLVGGGGAGGNTMAGGGGAGGFIELAGIYTGYEANDTIEFTVGAGGAAATGQNRGGNGGDTVLTLGETTHTAKGGGGGGGWGAAVGASGGSGGGSTRNGSVGLGVEGQGHAGARSASGATSLTGGGGGAGETGHGPTTSPNRSGDGGDGRIFAITGEYYGGGGGGGGSVKEYGTALAGSGGRGGGGDGGRDCGGENGADGYGGGGGGGGWDNTNQVGGKGGCGTVILVFKQTDLEVNQISDQSLDDSGVCRPVFTVVNSRTSQSWTLGGNNVSPDFDVEYTNNTAIGVAGVTIIGKGNYAGERFYTTFRIISDSNIATDDLTVRTLTVGNKHVYIFKNAAFGRVTVTARRSLLLSDCLLVGGGGAGGNTMGAGGGGGGVLELNGVNVVYVANDKIHLAVGAGGESSPSPGQRGARGGTTMLEFGVISDMSAEVSVAGGGAGGAWNLNAGMSGASGGGGCKTAAGGAGTEGLGFAGAAGSGDGKSGGGGGAGHAGYAADTTALRAGDGGEGTTSDITGEVVYYGGGGGAGGSDRDFGLYAPGVGGLGGGGMGGKELHGAYGVDGLGGGGGGAGYNGVIAANGGNGGAGAVILALIPADLNVDAIPDQYANPAGCTPEPVVRCGETLLVKDTDYTLAYTNNTVAGVATITITGIGAYAGKVGYASFEILQRLFVKPDVAEEGDGSSWENAMSWTNALSTVTALPGYDEIWLSGDMTLTAEPSTLTFTRSLVIRGGFAGTEVAPDERAAGAMSTIDGQGSYTIMTISNGAGAPVVLDGLRIFNGKRGIVKSGAGDITILNSAIVGNHTSSGGQNGIGLSLTGTADAKLVISNSVVSGNYGTATNVGQGQGVYVTDFGSVLITDTTFLTNGLAWTAKDLWNEGRDGQAGAALYLNNVAATVKDCTFRGNRGSSYSNRGGIVRVAGTSGGTLFDHCVFAGNEEDYHWRDETPIPNGGSNGGQIAINLSTEDARVTISNCTLACNLSDNSKSAVGVTVAKGTVVIKNSIIANNIVHYSNSGGADLALMTDTAHAEVSYSVLSADGPSSYTSLVEGNLSFGDGVRFGDPKLVSSTNDVNDLLVVFSNARKLRQFNKAKLDEVLALDVHALSPGGYFTNDGTEHFSDSEYSLAIDAGDSVNSVGDEPLPNGGIVNAGAYGGTAQASKTAPGAPDITGDVTVTFDEDYSRPTVRFTVGGTGLFFAQANVFITTNDVDWILVDIINGLVNGDSVACVVNAFYLPGYLRAKVILIASGVSDTAKSEATPVTKPLPPWWGKGGPANVIHVRPGAIGTGSGDNWSDAVPELRSAFSLVSAEKNEIWIAGTNVLKTGSIKLSVANPFVIRGGFHGWENSPEEREEGFRSVIDGDDKTECLTIANTDALEIERIYFTRALNCALIKTGAGDMRVSDCHFFTNGMDQATDSAGKGARVSGTKTTTVVTFTNCVFRGNRARTGAAGGCAAKGGGIYCSSLKCLRLEDSLFVHNGIHLRAPGGGNSGEPSTGDCSGSAVYSSVPVSAVGCRFAANFGTVRNSSGYGGTVRLVSGAEGSAFTNCAWVANGDMVVWPGFSADKNAAGALVVQLGSNSGTVNVERCTFAYNLADGFETTAGLNLILGTANVHNSIFFGNILGGLSSTRGRNISLRGESVCNVSYTLFGELGSNSVSCAETATTNFLDGIVVGDPLFVTEYATMMNLVKKSGNLIFWDWTTETLSEVYAALENANVHLRGGRGYFDKKTGLLVTEYCKAGQSPAIDAGDPKSDYSNEPDCKEGYHGKRVNLGCYGNTPWATMSSFPGFIFLVR